MLACLLVGAGTLEGNRQSLQLESQRSLGNGALAALLASPNTATAQRAALAIGRTRKAEGAPLLAAHVHDPRSGVRAASIYGLGLIGLGTQEAAITAGLTGEPSGAVRIAELDALGRYEAAGVLHGTDEAHAARAVLAALTVDPDPIVRGRAAITLSFFADGAQAEPAMEQLALAVQVDKNNAVRERAMWSIFRRYATRVPRAILRNGLHDGDEIVRIEAVRAYGRLKNKDAIADVKPLLADPSWRVQEQASESLIVLGGGDLTSSWAAIPAFVHLPSPQPDRLADQTPQPRPSAALVAPNPMDADLGPPLTLETAAQMTSPAHGLHPRLRLVTTKGNIYVTLYPEWAPLTVSNFINLMNAGFYDDNRWFRIVPDFVVQTGEKDDKNTPGPGYTIGAEENPVEQSSYVISMGMDYDGNSPKRDSAGSEYYITISPQYHLDNDFTVFGAMSGGFDVLGRLTESDRVTRIERIADVSL